MIAKVFLPCALVAGIVATLVVSCVGPTPRSGPNAAGTAFEGVWQTDQNEGDYAMRLELKTNLSFVATVKNQHGVTSQVNGQYTVTKDKSDGKSETSIVLKTKDSDGKSVDITYTYDPKKNEFLSLDERLVAVED